MAFCPPIPPDHPRVRKEKLEDCAEIILRSTACWRGYQGTWEIREGKFYLAGIRGQFSLSEGEPLFADWFSGVLRIPKGQRLHYVHMGFGSVFEEEIHIKIEQGLVTAQTTIDNRNQSHNPTDLGWQNLPGRENRFPGDDAL